MSETPEIVTITLSREDVETVAIAAVAGIIMLSEKLNIDQLQGIQNFLVAVHGETEYLVRAQEQLDGLRFDVETQALLDSAAE